MPWPLVLTAVVVLSVFAPGAAGAEEGESWQYQCLGDEESGESGGQICTTELVTFQNGEEFIVYFVHASDSKPPLVIAGETEDIAEASVVVGKNEPLSSRDCDEGTCFFSPEDSAELMKQFRKGFVTEITLKTGDDRTLFKQELSLRGFTTALTAPR